MTDNKIVIYFKGDVTEYEVPNKVIAGIMMILDEAIDCDAVDWMSVVSERGDTDD